MKQILDFIVIGAQKAGTTSLHQYLKLHPGIALPLYKESPFFSAADYRQEAFGEFLGTHFGHADEGRLWGKVTPHYMAAHLVPDRIWECLPSVRLVAILRDPVARAWSNYQMLVRREQVRESFPELVQAQTVSGALMRARELPALGRYDKDKIVVLGEYGRILRRYYELFAPEQVLVIFSEDLAETPAPTYKRVLRHIGAAEFIPDGLHTKHHEGGTEQRFPKLMRAAKSKPARALFRLIPEQQRNALKFWARTNNAKSALPEPIPEEASRVLRHYYQEDIQALKTLTELSVPAGWELDKHG